jgi:transcriptional regulator with XRE-family HTH domain
MTRSDPESIVRPDQQYEPPSLHLCAWRSYRALTQQELADRAGVSRRTVAAIEAGAVRPHPASIRALAAALKITPEQLRSDPPA